MQKSLTTSCMHSRFGDRMLTTWRQHCFILRTVMPRSHFGSGLGSCLGSGLGSGREKR